MSERRRAFRREPITVEVSDGREFVARPLRWTDRNDLGNEILHQYAERTNEQIQAFVNPEGVPSLQLYLDDKLKDPVAILVKAYPDISQDSYDGLEWSELLDLILTSCDVNGLESLRTLIDPNSPAPTATGGTNGSGESVQTETPKMLSTPDSDSQDSQEMKSSSSPTPSLTTSSESGSDSDGTNETGTSV